MKLNLLAKIYLANILILILLAVVLSSIGYVNFKSMSQYIEQADKQEESYITAYLVDALALHYQEYGNWQKFSEDAQQWNLFLHTWLHQHHKKRRVFKPKPKQEKPRFAFFSQVPPPKLPKSVRYGSLIERLSLLDADQQMLHSNNDNPSKQQIYPVLVNQTTVGWLSVSERSNLAPFSNFINSHFWQRILLMIVAGVLLSAVVSFYLARQITKPIHSLTRAAVNLSNRCFDDEIKVKSRDELAELAECFNEIGIKLAAYESQQKQWLLDISHELRTPLTLIQGEVESMIDGVTTPSKSELVQLKTDILRLGALVEDLNELSLTDNLDFSKASTKVDLALVCQATASRYRSVLAKRQVSLVKDCSRACVLGDEKRINQVLDNLLENCAKYTELGGTVWISCYTDEHGAMLVVQDSGPGVTEIKRRKLFDRLYRVDDHRNRHTGGAGIGLAICKNIVQAHGGQIVAKESKKGGLSVEVSLPNANVGE